MNMLTTYLHQIEAALSVGNATEHTYRPALQTLLQSLETGIVATNEPKRIRCGAPDFILTRGQTPLGYVEAKDVGKALDAIESDEQLKRYRESLGNLVLTDYLEFRWYVRGQHRMTARIGTRTGNKVKVEEGGTERVAELLNAFVKADVPTVASPRELAERMARLARLIHDIIGRALADEEQTGSLHQQMEGFRKTLLHDLTDEQFADMYAQTIAYGLFAARCNAPLGSPFTRYLAPHLLPKTNPFLRKIFDYIAGVDLDDRIVWAVDDLADLLARADMTTILTDFGRRIRQEDPVVHFYETFLAAYDSKMREARGVYYTPEPVVSYLVRSVDHLLKTDFKLTQGLADASKVKIQVSKVLEGTGKRGMETREVHKVQILDPATGTATFLYSIINKIYESFANNKGMWSGYVREHLLPRLNGFELLMAPYAVAHLKLGLLLTETGYTFDTDERLKVYLTNTLEEADEYAGRNLFAQWLADEANAADVVKRDAPVMVIIGNPPYSGHSANTGEWIAGLLRGQDTRTRESTGSYFQVDGQPLGERNPKWLNDDYVKFIRFSQRRIEQTGYGILAFITNHGYLDNPTFRGMRKSLMDTFDDLYLLNLHGNSKKKERTPDGGKDENVFDIQQGVAIGVFVKKSGAKKQTTVRHADLWGERENKYKTLLDLELATTEWTELTPSAPNYLFVPQNNTLSAEYEQGWRAVDVFPVNAIGLNSHRDAFAVAFDEPTLQERLADLRSLPLTDQELRDKYGLLDTSDFNLARTRSALRQLDDTTETLVPCVYRPFDFRFLFFHTEVLDRPRPELNSNFIGRENLALVTTRQTREPFGALAVDRVCGQHKIVAAYDGSSVFPLYLYPHNGAETHLFHEEIDSGSSGKRRANFAPEFLTEFANRLALCFIEEGRGDRTQTFGPDDIFSYMYAVLYSPGYRSRYAEFLKTDFPRLPLTSNPDLFRALCTLGDELVALHLMAQTGTNLPGFPETGSNTIDAVRYTEPNADGQGRVWINKEQYFAGVAPDVWNFMIGGYQVCQKWLKDRKGRVLSYDELTHYQRTCAALSETIRLMPAIDKAIDANGGFPIR